MACSCSKCRVSKKTEERSSRYRIQSVRHRILSEPRASQMENQEANPPQGNRVAQPHQGPEKNPLFSQPPSPIQAQLFTSSFVQAQSSATPLTTIPGFSAGSAAGPRPRRRRAPPGPGGTCAAGPRGARRPPPPLPAAAARFRGSRLPSSPPPEAASSGGGGSGRRRRRRRAAAGRGAAAAAGPAASTAPAATTTRGRPPPWVHHRASSTAAAGTPAGTRPCRGGPGSDSEGDGGGGCRADKGREEGDRLYPGCSL
ncbi:hypothetical protein GQ55_8G046100 [Panicum hallii var. hallii]|uniref:Uncharacterized protein n=1 Tax=Panicum hallii var. hallii TaxID=1504633 RepID=A0A2T7CKT6_9POAL|nr:hypothetical protein GQ55_8G046100 [Panicum hallii var. hallii]